MGPPGRSRGPWEAAKRSDPLPRTRAQARTADDVHDRIDGSDLVKVDVVDRYVRWSPVASATARRWNVRCARARIPSGNVASASMARMLP